MIEWIGIICCSSVISCMCSLLATSFCLSPTGDCLRTRLKRPIKTKNQNDSPECPCFPESAKIFQDEETFRGKSPSHYVVSPTSPNIWSYTHFEKNQSTESPKNQSQRGECRGQIINTSKENLNDSSICKNSTIPMSVCCNIPTETEIRKTIDEFNSVFQQYNELISRNPRQDFKKSQSSVKFQIPNTSQMTTNVGTMTEIEDCPFSYCKLNSKIKKCKCKNNKKGLRRNISTQSVRSVQSCSCSIRKSKSDLNPGKIASLKNVNKSDSIIKGPGYSKHRLTSKSSWISETIKRFRFRGNRKEKLICRCSNVNNTVL